MDSARKATEERRAANRARGIVFKRRPKKPPTSTTTYREYSHEFKRRLVDSLFRSGLSGFESEIMTMTAWHARIIAEGGFKP